MAEAADLFVAFKGEHRQVRDTVYALADALRDGNLDVARQSLNRLNRLAGPHFRYEEETLYPALRPYFPAGYIDSKLADHDGAIATAHYLVDLVQRSELSPAEREEGSARTLQLITHVSDCDGLAIIMERLSADMLRAVAANRDASFGEGLTLLEWSGSVRQRVA